MYIMKREIIQRNIGDLLLSFTERYANKKANSLCNGKLYEPKVPKKLKNKVSSVKRGEF